MTRTNFPDRAAASGLRAFCASLLLVLAASAEAGPGSVQGGALPQPVPYFPADNWWNTDISTAPVDANSANYIAYINNGGTRHLHPDFGGDVSTGSVDIYGFPYVVIDGTGTTAPTKVAVQFHYSSQSDGVDHNTDTSFPFYPVPPEAITQAHWVEGGDPGNVDDRNSQDRHLLIVDRDNKFLYELYNVFYDGTQWQAGSGAFFDMTKNHRRTNGWTSADAAGLAIFPGLVRYDEVFNAYGTSVTDIHHAFRVTVRATRGFVYPASHNAGSTVGALPMGARLRLKASKNISGFTPEMQKIFRAMKTYGLIVADNGSDMYVSGTYDTNWDNNILNPAFGGLSASDFDVIQLGWKPTSTATLTSISVSPSTIVSGNSTTGTATLSLAAPASGAVVTLTATTPLTVPPSVTIPSGATSATFPITSTPLTTTRTSTVSGTYAGVTQRATVTDNAAGTLKSLTINPLVINSLATATATVMLGGNAPTGGINITLTSSDTSVATCPPNVVVPAGAQSASFTVTAKSVPVTTVVKISGLHGGVTKYSTLTIRRAP